MPGVKRKATHSYVVPSKLRKLHTSSNVGSQLSLLRKQPTMPKLPMTALKWPSLKRKGTSKARKESIISKLPLPKWPTLKRKKTTTDATEASTELDSSPPRLRRAPTLPLQENESSSLDITTKKTLSKKPSSLVKTVSKSGNTTYILDEDETATAVTKLPSGSSIGKTTSFSKLPSSIKKELSKTPTCIKARSVEKMVKDLTVSRLLEKKTSVSKVSSIQTSISSASSSSVGKTPPVRKSISVKSAEPVLSDDANNDEGISSAPLLPPGGLMEIVFSFDTTGSMYSCLNEVKGRIQDLMQRLHADIPGIRIAIIAHGDYCDVNNYIVQWVDFGATVPELCHFVNDIKKTGGGDVDECYELVLRRVRNILSWTPGSQRSLVMIGDANPHEPSYALNTENIDWRKECDALKQMGVHIYGVHALSYASAKKFYEEISRRTDGQYLKLNNLSDIFNTIMAICYKEHGSGLLEAFQDEIKRDTRGRPGEIGMIFNTLQKKTPKRRRSSSSSSSPSFVPVKRRKKLRETCAKKKPKTNMPGKKSSKMGKTKAVEKSKVKRRVRHITRRRREDTYDSQFRKGDISSKIVCPVAKFVKWSPWQLAICSSCPAKQSVVWKPRPDCIGFQKKNLFKMYCDEPSIYEVGVRAMGKSRVYAVFYKLARNGFRGSVYTYMLQNPHIARQVNDILKQNGSILMRRGSFDKTMGATVVDTTSVYIKNKYTYAWNHFISKSEGFRLVKKGKTFVISGPSLSKMCLFDPVPKPSSSFSKTSVSSCNSSSSNLTVSSQIGTSSNTSISSKRCTSSKTITSSKRSISSKTRNPSKTSISSKSGKSSKTSISSKRGKSSKTSISSKTDISSNSCVSSSIKLRNEIEKRKILAIMEPEMKKKNNKTVDENEMQCRTLPHRVRYQKH